jgi:hypothetical protein
VTTPLGFFVLVVLVVEAGIGGLAAYTESPQRGIIILYMVIILVMLIAVVSALAFFRPQALSGQPPGPSLKSVYSVVISAPEQLPTFDITQISWNSDQCFLNYSGKRKRVVPVRAPVGLAFEIRFPPGLLDEISHTEPLDVELVDTKGLRWEIKPFFIFQTSVKLVCRSNKAQVLQAYGDGDEQ